VRGKAQMIKFRFGKDLDIIKLKGGVINDPKKELKRIQKIQRLFETEENVEAVGQCYSCGSPRRNNVIHAKVAYAECESCGLVYATRRIKAEVIKEFYRTNKAYSSTYTSKQTAQERLNDVFRPKVQHVLDLHDQTYFPIEAMWLDIGAGGGHAVKCALDAKCMADGVEPNVESRRFALKTWGIKLMPKMPDDGYYEIISLFGVLEHVIDPIGLLKSAREFMMDDSAMVIQVPNYDSHTTNLQKTHPEFITRHAEPTCHLMLFTLPSLKIMLDKVGLKLYSVWHLGLDMYEEALHNYFLHKIPMKKSLKDFNKLQQPINEMGMGDDLLVTAVRK